MKRISFDDQSKILLSNQKIFNRMQLKIKINY